MSSRKILLDVRNLSKIYKKGSTPVLNQVSLQIFEGETLGIVGESGCGKTTLARCLLRLIDPTDGEITYNEEIIFQEKLRKRPMPLSMRKNMQIVYQSPQQATDPRMTVKKILQEPLEIHNLYSTKEERDERVLELLRAVELDNSYLNKYPFELSGGEQQRLVIARALAVSPRFIVLDEAVSSLDLVLQSQIIGLLKKLQDECKLTYLFISHDYMAINAIAHRIAVMYKGRIVEIADTYELNRFPLHLYTKQLLSSVPRIDLNCKFKEQELHQLFNLELIIPENNNGCPWCNACAHSTEACRGVFPSLQEVRSGHYVACHNIQRILN